MCTKTHTHTHTHDVRRKEHEEKKEKAKARRGRLDGGQCQQWIYLQCRGFAGAASGIVLCDAVLGVHDRCAEKGEENVD